MERFIYGKRHVLARLVIIHIKIENEFQKAFEVSKELEDFKEEMNEERSEEAKAIKTEFFDNIHKLEIKYKHWLSSKANAAGKNNRMNLKESLISNAHRTNVH